VCKPGSHNFGGCALVLLEVGALLCIHRRPVLPSSLLHHSIFTKPPKLNIFLLLQFENFFGMLYAWQFSSCLYPLPLPGPCVILSPTPPPLFLLLFLLLYLLDFLTRSSFSVTLFLSSSIYPSYLLLSLFLSRFVSLTDTQTESCSHFLCFSFFSICQHIWEDVSKTCIRDLGYVVHVLYFDVK
jgi:hypothetical protein